MLRRVVKQPCSYSAHALHAVGQAQHSYNECIGQLEGTICSPKSSLQGGSIHGGQAQSHKATCQGPGHQPSAALPSVEIRALDCVDVIRAHSKAHPRAACRVAAFMDGAGRKPLARGPATSPARPRTLSSEHLTA